MSNGLVKRILVYALHVAVLVGVFVAISQSFIGDWIADEVIGLYRGGVGMGGLLYFIPLVVLMVLSLGALWLLGRWFGHRDG